MTVAEAKYFRILHTAPDAMVVIAADETIAFMNLEAERLFGHALVSMLGKPLGVLLPERLRVAHSVHFARYFEHPVQRTMGTRMPLFGLHADGTEMPIEVSLSPVETAEGVLVSAAIRDVTERRRAEEELRQARIDAEAGSAAKSEFLASMSHELRTPLNAILGYAQLLRRDKKEPLTPRHLERVNQLLKGGEQLLRLIDDMLDLSRMEAGTVSIKTERVHVTDVLEEVRVALEPMATSKRITMEIESVDTTLTADRARFAQILMNLGSNAIKYNRPNGHVTFKLAPSPTSKRVRVTVSDTGIGIDDDRHDTLFQPFERGGQELGPIDGAGVGLVITKRLAVLMGGDVGFRSVAGKGSDFWVELPAHAPRASSSPSAAPAPTAVRPLKLDPSRHLVLYVEDNAANVAFMKDFTDTFDFIELVSAPNAEVGVEVARARKPEVIIMDINLPGMSGLVALRVLRELPETKNIPVIALSAAASAGDRERGLAAGFVAYLTKPVKVDELLAALEGLLLTSDRSSAIHGLPWR